MEVHVNVDHYMRSQVYSTIQIWEHKLNIKILSPCVKITVILCTDDRISAAVYVLQLQATNYSLTIQVESTERMYEF